MSGVTESAMAEPHESEPTASDPQWHDITAEDLHGAILAPGPEDNKYTRGVVLLATGSQTYPGAAVLSAQAAGHAGAGMLRYTGPEKVARAVLAARPEVVRGLGRCNALVIGSGIPDIREDERQELMPKTRKRAAVAYPTVVDAGALTFVEPGSRDTVITPHAGELSTLLNRLDIADLSRADVEATPGRAAELAATAIGCTVLLKGHVSHIVSVDSERQVTARYRVTAPNSWMATAGTGDVLAGLLGALLAARHAREEGANLALDAACAAWLHGRAGWVASQRNAGVPPQLREILASTGELANGMVGIPVGAPVLALEVAQAIPAVIAALLAQPVSALLAPPVSVL
ncbi:ADP-dependent NAD(P)H-hydrate dehydratase [Gulosibacter chungangensis]|uniref:ADP-dependent (S)-NAD(P)H-hydrate dehydratase n=1 Tax=Gulosibacter chungangensis TaxID=979746 RepID=A0A7J5BBR1_9MICO|nr:ADP/ATP-dependent (S)-NAD(P)H-hydrate dehydratase [Gulosibacter chungangensis]KAB1643556.1 NAD(P)H-hydrate dehydratase [Gulosibacter chungangensis]